MLNSKKQLFLIPAIVFICLLSALKAVTATKYYYQIKIYHVKTQAQQDGLDKYLKDAYLPALHRQGIPNVGVFKSMEPDTVDKRVYIFIPYKTWDKLETTDSRILNDNQFLADGKDFINAPFNNIPYVRMETIVLRAFSTALEPEMPQLAASKADRVYELRSYESPTEQYHISKIKMFNSGETELFKRLHFNAVFYADVLAGSHMPNLMYMTTFNSKEDRNKHWDAFFSAPEWKELSARAEYQHNVSNAEITFLHPADYSDY